MEYFDYANELIPKKGSLLISEPFLPDPNFERTVIFLCEHNEDGSFGFIMNKPSLVSVDEIMEDIEEFKAPVFVGGPVQQNSFHFLHRNPDLEGAVEVLNGIYWGGNFEQLKNMIHSKELIQKDYKFFIGYSGWGENQLEEELETGSWIVSNKINGHLLFSKKPDELWKQSIKSLGGRFNIYSNYPVDPRLN